MKKSAVIYLILLCVKLYSQDLEVFGKFNGISESIDFKNKKFSELSLYNNRYMDNSFNFMEASKPAHENLLNISLIKSFNDPQENDVTDINTTRFVLAGAGLTGLFIGFHFYQMDAWWKSQRGNFHVLDDPSYSLKMDKCGHFYGGLTASKLCTGLSEWTGINHRTSTWIGAAIGSLWELYIEIEDGFGRDWGFSPSDATADVLGAFYPVVQEYFEPARAFNIKFSYLPSDQLGEYDENQNKKIVIDDYKGQTYWLTANIFELLPEKSKNDFPDYLRWINIGFGYGLDDYDMPNESATPPRHVTNKELYISLDYDLMKLLDIDTKFFRSLKESPVIRSIFSFLNYFHLPAPALRITFPAPYYPSPLREDAKPRGGSPYVRFFLFYFSK